MTWHAAKFLAFNSALLIAAAFAFFLFAAAPHRGETWLRQWGSRFRQHPVFGAFVRKHFISHERSLVRLSIGIVVVAASGYEFVHILQGVLTDSKLTAADVRLHNTLRLFHSEALHRSYSAVTRLANAWFLVPLSIALAGLMYAARRRRDALVLVAATFLPTIFAVVLKYLVNRPRPIEARPFVSGPSFPSGHTLMATVVYGFIAYVILADAPKRRLAFVAVLALLTFIVLVPLSRVYLGVHWPYDTLASLALGVALLAVLIEAMKSERLARLQHDSPPWFAKSVAVFAGLTIIAAGFYATASVEKEVRPLSPQPVGVVSIDLLRQNFPPALKRTSEDLVGGPMEPAAFVFDGDAAALVRSFQRAGWSLADSPSATGLLHELLCVIRDAPDPRGPATPSYYDGQPQDLTFERPATATGSIRHRHHIRVWREPLNILPAVPLWVATCSYDEGVKLVPKPYLLTHRIDPRVDEERELIASELRNAGVQDVVLVIVTGPRHGTNAGGDAFITDGRAHVMIFP
ncbi:MAG TPA: LssY C-terminal domain-containing protein [Thermoanaerobaculia bacterium]|nr:LssY C-terminal domain-containing protein [Thermoanaerobaculia bacterium]